MKLYGGHGPVRETTRPDASSFLACLRSAARKATARRTGTRNAASTRSFEPGDASPSPSSKAADASRAIARYSRSAFRSRANQPRPCSADQVALARQIFGAGFTGPATTGPVPGFRLRACAVVRCRRVCRRRPHSSCRSIRVSTRSSRDRSLRDVPERALVGGEQREQLHRQHGMAREESVRPRPRVPSPAVRPNRDAAALRECRLVVVASGNVADNDPESMPPHAAHESRLRRASPAGASFSGGRRGLRTRQYT